ncbi:MAG TPA: prolipoprotein diacylglyceryl transferase [Acholeplasmataceae bacterium]|nr:prolipoprotein diacylglyceryl transferase [Acholeplasmataceae bacterium]
MKLKQSYKKWLVLIFVALLFVLVGCSTRKGVDAAGNEITIIDRVAFTVFGRNIYWYAICIITGIALAYAYGLIVAKKIGFKEDDLIDGFIIGVLVGILGARLYYVIFAWKDGGYASDPLRIITGFINEEGGLAIHGAVFAVAIFVFFYWRKRKFDIYKLGEMLAPGFMIGQIVGRWGNFFNQEAHGGPISKSLAEGRAFLERLHLPDFIIDQMLISDSSYYAAIDSATRNYMHPTFLYESLWNLLGLTIVLVARRFWKKYWLGDAVLFYMFWYGIGRFFVESLRTDYLPLRIFGMELRVAQVVSVLMVLGGLVLFILRRVFRLHPVSYLDALAENKKAN